MDPAPRFPNGETLDRVRGFFAAAGYEAHAIEEALGVPDASGAQALPPALVERRLAGVGGALGLLLRLFGLSHEQGADEVTDHLGASAVRALESAGLVRVEPGGIRPTTRLLTAGDP